MVVNPNGRGLCSDVWGGGGGSGGGGATLCQFLETLMVVI